MLYSQFKHRKTEAGMKEYGELSIAPERVGRNLVTGRFTKGHTPANKGKKWSEFMGKRAQKRCMKGWANLDLHRNKNGRADTAGRCRKRVIAVNNVGRWIVFPYLGAAAEWLGGRSENIGRCCRLNQSRQLLHDVKGRLTDRINTDHRYKGIRWYYEDDNIWTEKINREIK